jgi:hypothetical protein
MTEDKKTTGSILATLGKVICIASPVSFASIFVFSWLFNTSIIHLGSIGGLIILVSIFLLPCLGSCLLISGTSIDEKQVFERLWTRTSGEVSGRVVILQQSKGRVQRIKLLFEDGTHLFINCSEETTGYVPELNDVVKINIDRRKRAIRTELVEKAFRKEVSE